MTIHECLLQILDSNEIKARVRNKQIKLNGEVISDTKIQISESGEFVDLGDFLFNHIDDMKIFSFFGHTSTLFGTEESNLPKLKFLSKFNCISISKKEHLVFTI